MSKNIEQYENEVVLLKKTLEFYGKKENYNNSLIEMDEGAQARYTMSLIEKNEDEDINTLQYYKDLVAKTNELPSMDKLMKEYKKIANNDK